MLRTVTIAMLVGIVFPVAGTLQAQESRDIAQLRRAIRALEQKVAELEEKVAQLEPLRKEYERYQRDRREIEQLGGTPGAIESTGKPVSSKTKLKAGQVLQAEDGGQWYAARVLGLEPDGQVKIHYIGWPSQFDEVLPRSRLQLDPDAVDKARKSIEQAPTYVTGRVSPSGIPVTANTALCVGQRLRVESGGNWWAGEVLELKPDGNVKIHYVGWDSTWDEVVPRTRLQLEPEDG